MAAAGEVLQIFQRGAGWHQGCSTTSRNSSESTEGRLIKTGEETGIMQEVRNSFNRVRLWAKYQLTPSHEEQDRMPKNGWPRSLSSQPVSKMCGLLVAPGRVI